MFVGTEENDGIQLCTYITVLLESISPSFHDLVLKLCSSCAVYYSGAMLILYISMICYAMLSYAVLWKVW